MPPRDPRPRVGCVGLGWIGRHRLAALAAADVVDIIAVADSDDSARAQAQPLAPSAAMVSTLDEVIAVRPDAVVLATPSALHAAQSLSALAAGCAVFCQKPLGRDAREVLEVIDTARDTNRLLGADMSYRYAEGLARMRDLVRASAIGRVFAVDLTFHNAYGPDKPWFYDLRQAGGGCLLDLGVHLIDFLHWTFESSVARTSAHLFAEGRRLEPGHASVEDYAIAEVELDSGVLARLACSWRLSAGCDAEIDVSIFGTGGGLRFHNVNGSFYDFVAEQYRGTQKQVLCAPPDDWGGRAIVDWARRLAGSNSYDPAIEISGRVATTLDLLYGRATTALSQFPEELFT
jgi:predicted dehydrogenase